MEKLVCFCALVLAVIATAEAVCKVKSDCGAGECCYIRPQFLVASRRRQLILPQPVQHDTGICEKYHTQGEHCYGLEVANGHCGCEPGTGCRWVPDPTTTAANPPSGRRSMIYHAEPGAYKCVAMP